MTELSQADRLALLPEEERNAIYGSLTKEQQKELLYDWKFWARPKQLRPFEDDWNTFLMLCGRGFGKTRTAVQWVREKALKHPGCRIAMVGATAQVANRTIVMDLMDVCKPDEAVHKRGDALIKFTNGSTVFIWSADEPRRLRGSNHHFALADDIVAWRYAETYHMLKLTLRSGLNPQMFITTSAAATPLILNIISQGSEDESVIEKAVEEVNSKDFVQKGKLIIVRGTTFENNALPQTTLEDYKESYPEESITGQQELYAKIVMKVDGALWDREWIQHYEEYDKDGKPILPTNYVKTVLAVDIATTSNKNSDYTAIVVTSRGSDGKYYVRHAKRYKVTPGEWAQEIVKLYKRFNVDKIVAEVNNGGELVEHTLRQQNSFEEDGVQYDINPEDLPIETIHAKHGKILRATPIAMIYENKRVWHVGIHSDLEQQMVMFKGDPNENDDMVDALVYSLLDLSGARILPPQPPMVGGPRKINELRFI